MPSSGKVVTMGYYGGKSSGNAGSGRWVASMLPQESNVTYCEPFCGMCGILIQRRPADVEIVNDKNHRLVNFLSVVRDITDEIAWKIHYTEQSERDFNWAVDNVDNLDLTDVERARAFYAIVNFSIMHGDERSNIGLRWKTTSQSPPTLNWGNIQALAERLQRVQILCRDAADVIERLSDERDAVIYCDPPYPTSDVSPYLHKEIDKARLADVLAVCKGKVAISGYNDEWDSLGWERHEFKTTTNKWRGRKSGLVHKPRTEVLWTNYEPPQRRML